ADAVPWGQEAAARDWRVFRVTSVREGATRRRGAGGTGRREGTATTWQPAAVAEVTPFGESSRATHCWGSASRSLAARRYGSGSGLVRVTSSPVTTTGKRKPVLVRTASVKGRWEPVTRAHGTAAAATSASSARTPGRTVTRPSAARLSMPSVIQRATSAGDAGLVALASR